MTKKEILEYLCYYDLRNPNGIIEDMSEEELKEYDYGNHAQKNCFCDDCFYGRAELAEELLKYVKDENI